MTGTLIDSTMDLPGGENMRGQQGADALKPSLGRARGQQISLFSATNGNVFIFFRASRKFLTNLSEITALLPPTTLNYLILKYKVVKKWGAVGGQLGGSRGQKWGSKPRGKHICPLDFRYAILLFQGVIPRGHRGQSEKSKVNRSSRPIWVSDLCACDRACPPCLRAQKDRFFSLYRFIRLVPLIVIYHQGLARFCTLPVLSRGSHVSESGRMLSELPEGLTAHFYRLCGYGVVSIGLSGVCRGCCR